MPPTYVGVKVMTEPKISIATLGVPRIGRRRELKFALESYWSGKSSPADLQGTAKKLRAANWTEQRDRGITRIPANDFSLYDHMLDTAVMVGAIPAAYGPHMAGKVEKYLWRLTLPWPAAARQMQHTVVATHATVIAMVSQRLK
jgi:hypothetical protein